MSASLSVVVASLVGPPFIDGCLNSLRVQARALDAEVICVASGTEDYATRIAREFPWVRLIHRQGRDTVPALRRHGVDAARGDLVAIIEEHCTAAGDWMATARAALDAQPFDVAGGPISAAEYERLRDWVVYFVEYNGSLPPAPEGETTDLNGANIVYRREVLLAYRHLLDQGYWEASVHPQMLAGRARFRSVPGMRVFHHGPFDFGYYLQQRYWFSRAFAGARAASMPMAKRAAYLAAAPLVPGLLLARMGLRVWQKRCHTGKFVAALPLLVPAVATLVAGEWVGYLVGPGRALSRVE